MSTTTTHFDLVKQEGHEYPSLNAINSNLDTIDDELYDLGQAVTDISSEIGTVPSGKTVQGQIDTLSDSVSSMIVGSFTITINENTADSFAIISFPQSLPSGKNYGAVLTVQKWVSTHAGKPVLAVRSIQANAMNVHASVPEVINTQISYEIDYIAFAF